MATRLRIKAEDAEDLQVISAHLQDAVLKLADIAYLPRSRQFTLMLNRFRWESTESGRGSDVGFAEAAAGRGRPNPRERIRAGLTFSSVLRVRRQGIAQQAGEQVLALLAIAAVPGEDGAASILLTFAGQAQLRLDVECIDVRLEDLGEPWPVRRRPAHAVE